MKSPRFVVTEFNGKFFVIDRRTSRRICECILHADAGNICSALNYRINCLLKEWDEMIYLIRIKDINGKEIMYGKLWHTNKIAYDFYSPHLTIFIRGYRWGFGIVLSRDTAGHKDGLNLHIQFLCFEIYFY